MRPVYGGSRPTPNPAATRPPSFALDRLQSFEQAADIEHDTGYYTTDCNGNVIDESHVPETYKRYRFTLVGIQPGEQLWVNWLGAGIVQPASGMCPADLPLPEPSCSSNYDGCAGDDFPPARDLGESAYPFACNAGGSPAWLVGVGVALAFARRGDRKQKRRPR